MNVPWLGFCSRYLQLPLSEIPHNVCSLSRLSPAICTSSHSPFRRVSFSLHVCKKTCRLLWTSTKLEFPTTMFTKKYFTVPGRKARPVTPPSPVTCDGVPILEADGTIKQKQPKTVLPHVDFHAQLVGYSKSSSRDSLYVYAIIVDKKIWRTHRRNMDEMQKDYDENYVERMGDVETFPAGVSAVVWSLTGGKPLFVRVTVIRMREQMDMPHFVCNGWDDCEEYVVNVNEIFVMTPQAAEYPCLAMPLSLEGLHGFYDSSDMLSSLRTAWAECGAVYAGRCVRLKPNPEFVEPEPREPARMRTYELRSFRNQSLNDKIAEEFVKQMDINKYKSKKLHVVVTSIDHYSNIWIQLEDDGCLERINLICDQNARFKKPLSEMKKRPSAMRHDKKRVFAALGIDGKHHRAIVFRENGADGALVEFIDYGTVEDCKYSNMYDLTHFDTLTALLGPRCIKALLHNASQKVRLKDNELEEMLERVQSFAPDTTVAVRTGEAVDVYSKEKIEVYEIRGGLGRKGLDIVNIHGKPYYSSRHPKAMTTLGARQMLRGIPEDRETEEEPPVRSGNSQGKIKKTVSFC